MHDVTQAEMAKAIGVHVTTVSQIEHGRCRPGISVLCKIWEYTGLSAEALLRSCMGKEITVPAAGVADFQAARCRRRLKK